LLTVKPKSGTVININGKTYRGERIEINGDSIIVNGKVIDSCEQKEISVKIDGDVKELTTSTGDVVAKGVGRLTTTSGDIKCGTVSGDVQTTSGDIECTSIDGSVQTVSGDVSATSISGSARTISGDISK